MVAVISQPHPQNVPAMSAEVITTPNSLSLKHNGGDTLNRGDFKILVDGQDKTAAFGDPTAWSIGQTLTYSGNDYNPQNPPGTIQIVYTGGGAGQLIEQVWVKPPTLTMVTSATTSTVSPTASTTSATPTPVPAPVASFTATPTSGSLPLTVTFTDTSTGTPTSWNWIFGDTGSGNSSSSQNSTHTYTVAGTYTAKLTVTNSGGSSSASRTITVNAAPPQVTGISPTSGRHNTNIAVAITGTGFQTSGTMSVLLISDDTKKNTTISGYSISVTNSTYLTCSFNLPTGAYVGTYDIQITNPDGQTSTHSAGFSVT